MSKETTPEPTTGPEEARPIDLGLSEGKSMAFAPTSAIPPEGPPIGGLVPASPSPNGSAGGDPSTPPAAASQSPPSGSDD